MRLDGFGVFVDDIFMVNKQSSKSKRIVDCQISVICSVVVAIFLRYTLSKRCI